MGSGVKLCAFVKMSDEQWFNWHLGPISRSSTVGRVAYTVVRLTRLTAPVELSTRCDEVYSP